MIKFKFNNKLVDLYLIIAWVTPFIFGITFPIASKMKGMMFAASFFSAILLIHRLAGLVQPIIYKSNISLKKFVTVMIAVDVLWSLNLFYFIYSDNMLLFLYIHIALNVMLDVLYTSMSFKLDKKIADMIDLEEFKITEHTLSTASGIIVSGLVTLLLIKEVTIPYLLAFAATINILLQIVNYKIYKELTNE